MGTQFHHTGKNKSCTGLHSPENIKVTPEKFIPGFNQTFHALEKIISFPKNYFISSENIICALKICSWKKKIKYPPKKLYFTEIIDIFGGKKIRGRND